MDLRQLRYYIAVAEELHFSRAAARLNLAQSALSSQVRALEREVGGPLLVRSTRRVELTPAGERLLRDGREVVAAADGALERARALARGEAGTLVIGSMGPAGGGLLAPLLARFSSRHPRMRVEIRNLDFSDIVEAVRERQVDLAFIYMPLAEPDLEFIPLMTEPRVVVLPRGHRLARRKRIRPTDLRDEVFIMQPEEVPQIWRDHWLLVDDFGARPRISPRTADTLEDWLTLIGQGEGVDTAPAIIARYYAWPDVAFVPLVDSAPATLALARRREESEPLLDEFTALALEVAAATASDPGG
ncbi:MAG TPA: LysR substrate-binding domain-containing protein [Solirubrobacteraceae bacterium]|nr:LysR substrate-binding domain-containing protein [Solirubrobacteraceae bacterium]